jgi:hypothetical protein
MPFNSYPIGSTPMPGTIGTTNQADTYPTHYDFMGSGGHRAVASITERNDIVTERRAFGMLVTVTNDPDPANNKTYILRNIAMGGVSDNLFDDPNWGEFQAGVPGPPGPVGIAPAGLTWQGTFDSDATNITYVTGDVVQYTDPTTGLILSYWAVSNPTVVDDVTAPPTDINGDPNTTAGWQLFSAVGPQGPPGDQGDPGDDGLQGDAGSQWFNGELTPNIADPAGSIDGDYYLHLPPNDGTGNGDVYRKLSGSWTVIGNIRGADGTGTGGLWPTSYPQTTTATITSFSGPAGTAGYSLTGKTGFEILRDLLCPYGNPNLSSFKVFTANTTNSQGTTNNQDLVVEVGTVISGTRWFRTAITNPGNILPSTMKVTQISNSGGQTIIYGSTAPGEVVPASNTIFPSAGVTINSVSYSTHDAQESWKASVLNTLNSLRESNLYTVTWRYRVYWGCSTALTLDSGSDITGLIGGTGSGALVANQSNTYTFSSTTPGYRYLCYPVISPFTGVGNWLDQNGSNVPTSQDAAQGFTNADGQGRFYKQIPLTVNGNVVNYRVYRTHVQANSLAQFTL